MFPGYNFWICEVAQQRRIYISKATLCLPNKTKLGTWRSVCIGSRNTALAFAAAQTLVYGSELGFLGPHWQLSSNTWTDWTSSFYPFQHESSNDNFNMIWARYNQQLSFIRSQSNKVLLLLSHQCVSKLIACRMAPFTSYTGINT